MKYITFDQIPVWQNSHKLTVDIYTLTKKFPIEEKYSLTSQLRRAASSVPANIVEGFYRHTTKELLAFLYNARGSAGETHYHLILARDLGYLKEQEFKELAIQADGVVKELSAWIISINHSNQRT